MTEGITIFIRILQRHFFACAVFFLLLIYTILHLTPSSYGLALEMFGYGGEGLLWGSPRAIRSDEFAVWTPYFQSIVNNNFSGFNRFSMYHEKFRGFVALPVADWGIIFKPYFWSFFVFEPARAFSIYHGLIIAAFVLGWKLFFDRVFTSTSLSNRWLTPLASLILFFSGFVQTWWTTLGPLLALTPWFLLALFKCKNGTLISYVALWYVATMWLLSHTYPPVIVSCAYVAGFTYLAFNRNIFSQKFHLFMMGIASGLACLVAYLYLQDSIAVMSQTVFPGQRVSYGGDVSWPLWLSVFIPYITHSNYQDLMNVNICEVGALNSLLPLMALCFTDFRNARSIEWRKVIILFVPVVIFSLWMLGPVLDHIGKLGLLYLVPGRRMVFALGISVHLLALYFLCLQDVKLTVLRIGIFSLCVLFGYMLPAFYADFAWYEKSAWELLAPIVLIIAIALIHLFRVTLSNKQTTNLLLGLALLINFVYFGAFNPGQSAEPIFELKNRPEVQALYNKQEQSATHTLFEFEYPGAILTGLGLNSFATVLMEPQLEFFRQLFPDLDETRFNEIFNRYAHIQLYSGSEITNPYLDVVRIPLAFVTQPPSIVLMPVPEMTEQVTGGFIDEITLSGNNLNITGWAFFSGDRPLFFSNLDDSIVISIETVMRHDVVAALGEKNLLFSGFGLQLRVNQSQLSRIKEQGICLYSIDVKFGVRRLGYNDTTSVYSCR